MPIIFRKTLSNMHSLFLPQKQQKEVSKISTLDNATLASARIDVMMLFPIAIPSVSPKPQYGRHNTQRNRTVTTSAWERRGTWIAALTLEPTIEPTAVPAPTPSSLETLFFVPTRSSTSVPSKVTSQPSVHASDLLDVIETGAPFVVTRSPSSDHHWFKHCRVNGCSLFLLWPIVMQYPLSNPQQTLKMIHLQLILHPYPSFHSNVSTVQHEDRSDNDSTRQFWTFVNQQSIC